MELWRGLVDAVLQAFQWHTALHVAQGAPFRGHNEPSVDKLGQLRLFEAKQLSRPASPPSSLSLFTLHPDMHTRKLHSNDYKHILTSTYASCHCHWRFKRGPDLVSSCWVFSGLAFVSSEQVPTKDPVCFLLDSCIIYQRAVSRSCDPNKREVTTVNCMRQQGFCF